MPFDYSTSQITLRRLVNLTGQFLTAAHGCLKERDAGADLRLNMTAQQSEDIKELVADWANLNDQVDQIVHSGIDLYRMDTLTHQIDATTLQIHDIMLSSAEKLLGKPTMQFIAPEGLRTVSACELLELNHAKTIKNLMHTTLQ